MASARNEELERSTPAEDATPLINTNPVTDRSHPPFSWAQQAGQAIYSLVVDGVPGAMFLMNTVFTAPIRYEFVFTSACALASIKTADALHTLTKQEHPFLNFNIKTPLIYTLSALPPLAVAYGIDKLIQATLPSLIENHIELLSYLVNPLIQFGSIALLSQFLFWLTKTLLEYTLKQSHQEHNGNQTSHFQAFLGLITRPTEPIIFYEAVRQTLLYQDQTALLSNEFFMMLIIVIDQAILGLRHLLEVKQPGRNLFSRQNWPKYDGDSDHDMVLVQIDDELEPRMPPSNKQVATRVAWNTLRAALVIGMCLAVTEFINSLQDAPERNPEKFSTSKRLCELYFLVMVAAISEPLIDISAVLIGCLGNKLTSCISSLWKPKPATSELLPPMEMKADAPTP